MNKLLKDIETVIINNKDLVDEPIIHQTDKGYMKSRDKEVLISISKEYYYGDCFYAHVFKDYHTNKWVSLISWRQILTNENSNMIFQHYAKAISNETFAPSAIQNEDDAFKLNDTFEDACISLKKMIDVFEVEERIYNHENVFHSKNSNTRLDMRIYSVYY